jgi:type IV secretory pathway VirB2 component (pilin)
VLALLSPVLWAWYLVWGVLLLAPIARGRLRRALVAVICAGTLLGAASVKGVANSLASAPPVETALLVAALAVLVGLVAVSVSRDASMHDPVLEPLGESAVEAAT